MDQAKVLQSVLETVSQINETVTDLKTDVAGLKVAVTVLDQKVTGLDQKVNRLDQKVTAIESDVSALRTDFSEMKLEMSDMRESIEFIKDNAVTQDEFKEFRQEVKGNFNGFKLDFIDYLDDKVRIPREDALGAHRKTDRITDILVERKVLTESDRSRIAA
ncbi:hypothetical protein HYV73_03840 [Candidatus Uhrbacteria bacterium]|nr:hypothetical protein [Candidatus Uhrbacteria bacterium]